MRLEGNASHGSLHDDCLCSAAPSHRNRSCPSERQRRGHRPEKSKRCDGLGRAPPPQTSNCSHVLQGSRRPRPSALERCRSSCTPPHFRVASRINVGTSTVAGKSSIAREMTLPNGTVKFFNSEKGFGFISPDGGGTDTFVHISAVERSGLSTLREGQKVSYEIVQDRRSGKAAAENISAL